MPEYIWIFLVSVYKALCCSHILSYSLLLELDTNARGIGAGLHLEALEPTVVVGGAIAEVPCAAQAL